ncbi:hypothetical protein ABW286_20955 [Erwinia papayae]|uniref:Uncharacterized protein n=1 Tax=Erwinia papayae TaxID=206499 RepID=A0ABV3N705_9GAMM
MIAARVFYKNIIRAHAGKADNFFNLLQGRSLKQRLLFLEILVLGIYLKPVELNKYPVNPVQLKTADVLQNPSGVRLFKKIALLSRQSPLSLTGCLLAKTARRKAVISASSGRMGGDPVLRNLLAGADPHRIMLLDVIKETL